MTWQECRRLWGAHVTARKAKQGRTFYSYLNRRLDVLVDPTGKVIKAESTSGNKLLAPSAIEAVKQWKFAPGDATDTFPVSVNFQKG